MLCAIGAVLEDIIVLGMIGLFGALLAGVVADSVIGGMMAKPESGAADDPDTDSDATQDGDTGADMLDFIGDDDDPGNAGNLSPDDPDYTVVSDDGLKAVDPDQVIDGGQQGDIIVGRGGDDDLAGGNGGDQILGRDGADWMQGGAGDDIELGGAGADTIQGGSGNDLLQGEAGNDWLVGGAGGDTLLGADGADHLYGSAGQDTAMGGGGDDRLDGGEDADWLAGGAGADTLVGGTGGDTLDGGLGDDVLDGRDGPDVFPEMDFLNGGDGDDRLLIGSGDYASGGDGADWFELSDMTEGGTIAHITDYDVAEDAIVVVFDADMHPDPVLSLETPENSADVIVLLDGVPLAMVQGGAGMTLDDVLMTPAQAA